MQVWRKYKVNQIVDYQTDDSGVKCSTRKVMLGVSSDMETNPGNHENSAVNVEVTIESSESSMLSQIFDGEIGHEIEIRFTAGDMLKEKDDTWARIVGTSVDPSPAIN